MEINYRDDESTFLVFRHGAPGEADMQLLQSKLVQHSRECSRCETHYIGRVPDVRFDVVVCSIFATDCLQRLVSELQSWELWRPKISHKVADGSRMIHLATDCYEYSISRRPITVAEYHRFAIEAGFVTKAELDGDSETYFRNSIVDESPDGKMDNIATCLSFDDCIAYCRSCKANLPTEDEWIQAAVIEWQELAYDDRQKKIDKLFAEQKDRMLLDVSSEWTVSPTGRPVVRRGPLYTLERGFPLDHPRYRICAPRESYDLLLGFRIVYRHQEAIRGGKIRDSTEADGRE